MKKYSWRTLNQILTWHRSANFFTYTCMELSFYVTNCLFIKYHSLTSGNVIPRLFDAISILINHAIGQLICSCASCCYLRCTIACETFKAIFCNFQYLQHFWNGSVGQDYKRFLYNGSYLTLNIVGIYSL